MTAKEDSGRHRSPGRSPQNARKERLAAALRANLKRRKMQARRRAEDEKEAAPRREPPGSGRQTSGN